MKQKESSTYKAIKKLRGDWGSVSPVTKSNTQ